MIESGADASCTLRGGVVGYGFISERGHLPAYALGGRTRFAVAAVADTCAKRRDAARAALPWARIYESHEALLENEVGRIDFVDVSAPPFEHGRIARHALTKGFHVLCEKPLATSADEARAMATMARETRHVLFPCHNYKHAPAIRAVREILDLGLIGPVHLVTLQTFRDTHARGVSEWRPDWRRDKRVSGGGIAMDHGSHTFYLAFDWLGGYPTAITAKMSASDEFDTEDNFACSMTFPSGTATAHLSWTAGVRKVMYTIHGAQGAVSVEDDDVEIALMQSPKSGRRKWEFEKRKVESDWMSASHVGWFRSLFDQFADAIVKRDYVSRETTASLHCVELIAAAYASARDASRERTVSRGP